MDYKIRGPYGRVWPLDHVLANVGDGWSKIVQRLIRDLFTLGWDGELHQIKEKFGSLRFYIGGGSNAIFDRINQAENESFKVCEACGEPGSLRGQGWLLTRCTPCWEEYARCLS
jgi:hypothetical protein